MEEGSEVPSQGARNAGRGRSVRVRGGGGTDESSDVKASKQRRTLTDDEKKDFISYQQEIDERRDRCERIVKLSRDIIIECKRIIFQLHRITAMGTANDKEKVLEEADKRVTEVRDKMFRQIAKELCGLDQYFYLRSYDWALEEYIEACAFYKFLKSGSVLLYSEVTDGLCFDESDKDRSKKLYVELPEMTYLLGLSDVGGELMRLAISEISSENCDTAASVVNYMRSLYGCYEVLGNISPDYTKKLQILRESLMKVENALYKWKIRENDQIMNTSVSKEIRHVETDISA